MSSMEFSTQVSRPWGLPPDYFFCIKEYVCEVESNREICRYVNVVKLGQLTEDEAGTIFNRTLRPIIDIVDNNKIKTAYSITDLWKFFGVIKLESGKVVKDQEAETNLWQSILIEPGEIVNDQETDFDLKKFSAAVLLRWNMMSESFFRGRYQAALRQHDQIGFSKPTNETILAAAIQAVELLRPKTGLAEYAAPLPTGKTRPIQSSFGSVSSGADTADATPSIVWPPAQKGGIKRVNIYIGDDIDQRLNKIQSSLEGRLSAGIQKQRTSIPSAERKETNRKNSSLDEGNAGAVGEIIGRLGATANNLAKEPKSTLPQAEPVDLKEIDVATIVKQMEDAGPPSSGKNTKDENWVHSGAVAKHLDIESDTLRKYRSKGKKAENGLAGVDNYGRAWRKRSANAHVYYYRPTVGMPFQTVDSESQTMDSVPNEQ